MAAPEPINLAAALGNLRPKDKQPSSARVLNAWIAQAELQLGSDGGRLGWLVASTIITAALQQAVDELGEPLFLLKGGTPLQHRLPGTTRSTTDLDGLVRGDIDPYIDALDEVLQRPQGACQLRRGPVTNAATEGTNRVVKEVGRRACGFRTPATTAVAGAWSAHGNHAVRQQEPTACPLKIVVEPA